MSTPDTLIRELSALDDALAGRPVDPDLAGLAELALALRDDRPAPSPAYARSLDERARRGFPGARARGARRRGIKLPRVPLPALGVAASALVVVVIAVSIPREGDSSSSSGGGATVERVPSAVEPESASRAKPAAPRRDGATATDSAPATTAPPATAIGPLPVPTPPVPGFVERSAQLVLATPPRDIDADAAEILRITEDVGGWVVSSTVSSGSSGQFELRVPERRLQAALSRLSRVARVRERTQSAQDITGAVVSVRERLGDARTERRSLLRQLAAASTPNQTASIRARLRLVSAQIAGAKRDLANVRSRATHSTIAVTLLADRRAAAGTGGDGGGWTPGDALDD